MMRHYEDKARRVRLDLMERLGGWTVRLVDCNAGETLWVDFPGKEYKEAEALWIAIKITHEVGDDEYGYDFVEWRRVMKKMAEKYSAGV